MHTDATRVDATRVNATRENATRENATRVNATRENAVYETMRLYHAWIGYLLTRLGERTVRVQVEDIRDAMDRFRCSVSREADAYVIRLDGSDPCRKKEEAVDDGYDREGKRSGD